MRTAKATRLRLPLLALVAAAASGCVDSYCFNRGDCPAGQTCNVVTGRCVADEPPPADVSAECRVDADCEAKLGPLPPCRVAVCAAGRCVEALAPAGTPCDDGDACSPAETCDAAGACVGDTSCDDDNPCTADTCDPAVGCDHTPVEGSCDDGDPCTGTAEAPDRCEAGVCVGGAPNPQCACEDDEDCLPFEDDDLCNGTLRCDREQDPPRCAVDPATIVSCPEPTDPCLTAACVPETGACETAPRPDGAPCDDGDPCTAPDRCVDGGCVPGADVCPDCPADMVEVDGRVCLDRYEASRPDATAASPGSDTSRATSRPGVLPWFPVGLAEGRAACEAAGKRLCRVDEWVAACGGSGETRYPYGDAYDPLVCNGIDTFCRCGAGTECAGVDPCPYPHCFLDCGAAMTPLPTGSLPDCVSEDGAFDVSGNVWELLDAGDGQAHYRGGAYNCIDSERLHACTYDATSGVSARGFRCCADLDPQEEDR